MKSTWRARLFWTAALLGLAVAGKIIANCALPFPQVATEQPVSNIKVLAADDGGTVCQSCVDQASSRWNNACGPGTKPTFVGMTESAEITAFVRFKAGGNPGSSRCKATKCACAFVMTDPGTGRITMASVSIWQTAQGQNCAAHASDILTHEFAHILGIADPPMDTCDGCTNIMGNVTGPIDSAVCDQIDRNFRTNQETASIPINHPCHPQFV